MSFPSYFHQIYAFFTRVHWALMLFLAFDSLISDYIWIKSLVILWINNLLQNIFDSSLIARLWLKRLRNFIKISVTTSKPANKKMHVSPTFKFLSMPMVHYSCSFEFVLTYFVSYKIGSKILFGTFFRIALSFLEVEIRCCCCC